MRLFRKESPHPSSFCLLQSQVAEKGRELKELKDTLTLVLKEKEKLEEVRHGFHFLFYRLLPGLRKKNLPEKCHSSAIFPLHQSGPALFLIRL